MRENATLMMAAAAYEGSNLGTPAGQMGGDRPQLSQEQHAWLRQYRVEIDKVTTMEVMVPRWRDLGLVPPEMRSQTIAAKVTALIAGEGIIVLPTGMVVRHPQAKL